MGRIGHGRAGETGRRRHGLTVTVRSGTPAGRAHHRTPPNFDYERVRAALAAALSPDALTLEEQTVWLDQVDGYLAEPGADPSVAAAFDDLARRPGAAGRDADGNLVVIDKDTAETS